jgi:hypothetical protein
MKLHFISSILFTGCAVYMALAKNENVRLMLLVPVIIFFCVTLLLYAVDYDRAGMKAWKKKEEKIREELASEQQRKG